MKMKRNNHGLSLVELMVTLAIAAVIIVTAMSLLANGTNLYGRGLNEVNLQDEAQMTLNQINDILMEASSSVSFKNNTLVVERTDGTTEYVMWDSAQQKLFYYTSGDASYSLMADYVDSFSVTQDNDNPAKVIVAVGMTNGTRHFTADQTVFLRNASKTTVSIATTAPTPEGSDGGEVTGTPAPAADGDDTLPGTPIPEDTDTPKPADTDTPVPQDTSTPTPAGVASDLAGYIVDSSVICNGSTQGYQYYDWRVGNSNSYCLQYYPSNSVDTVKCIVGSTTYTLGTDDYIDLGNGLKVKMNSQWSNNEIIVSPIDGITDTSGTFKLYFTHGQYVVAQSFTYTVNGSGQVSVK